MRRWGEREKGRVGEKREGDGIGSEREGEMGGMGNELTLCCGDDLRILLDQQR